MRAPISIVIPTYEAEAVLPACLEALMEGVAAGLVRELIISDGGSTDRTVEIASEAGAEVVTGPASRGGQLRRGGAAAGGDWVLFLHADSVLEAGWSDVVSDVLDAPERAYAFRLRFRARGFAPRFVAGWANLRSGSFGLPYGDQGLLISRDLYQSVDGFSDQPLMEDVAMARALRGQLALLDHVVATGAERYQRAGWMRRGARNLWILTRYFAGVSPERLARAYRR